MNTAPPQNSKFSDLGLRTASALVLIPLVLLDVWSGGWWFEAIVLILGIVSSIEMLAITAAAGSLQRLLYFATIVAVAVFAERNLPLAALFIVAGVVLSNLQQLNRREIWPKAGLLYIACPVLAFMALRSSPQLGFEAIIVILLMVWFADTLAYFAGRIIGGPKLAPRLSPKKTWAGLGGAVAGAMLAAAGYQIYSGQPVLSALLLVAALLAVVEQAGDILESGLKRAYGVKDSGTLIPGHGGMLDRVDGLMAVALAAAVIGYLRNPSSPAAGFLLW